MSCTDVKEPPIPMRGHSPICITKWVDYSVKYGFGFLLTDGSVGVLFPDTTRMLLAADDRYLIMFIRYCT
jgi:hypothetical protein